MFRNLLASQFYTRPAQAKSKLVRYKKAAITVGRDDLSAHDLRRFAGSENARVATLAENMNRLGHKTVDAALHYQHSQDGRDAIVAAALSANALAQLAAAASESTERTPSWPLRCPAEKPFTRS